MFQRAITDSNEFYLRIALFWDIVQRIVVISCRRFGTTYRSCFQGSRNPERKPFFLDLLTLEHATDTLYQNVGKDLPLYTA
jgi:hypothetical protein